MSKENFMRVAERELQSLNRAIDQKIISGLPYTKESKRHKFLMTQLSRIRRQNIFERSFGFISTLMF